MYPSGDKAGADREKRLFFFSRFFYVKILVREWTVTKIWTQLFGESVLMKTYFHSIQTKFSILTMAVILLSAGVVGGTGLLYASQATDKGTARTMNSICQEEGARLDALFLRIEQSVNIVAHNALQQENLEEHLQNSIKREAYLAEMEPILLGAAGSTRGAVAVYLRFNPEIAPSNTGLFYSKSNRNQEMLEQENTDFSRYSEGEMKTLEWYQQPVEAGEPVWMAPYNNGKIAERVISYVMPLYQEDTLIGVVGMDILFDDIVQEINAIEIYDTGYAYMLDKNHEMIYHPLGEESCPVEHNHEEWEAFVGQLEEDEQREYVFTYEDEGQQSKMTYCNLENGMRLVVTAPTAETDQLKVDLEKSMMVSVVLISIFCIMITIAYTQTIVKPLKELTKAAKQVAEGNLEVTLLNQSHDEVGELSTSFQQTVDCLKVYMDRMNELAYRDPLTGVKSKTAYDEETRKVNNGLQMGFDQFGILMLDINGLKLVNDQYGHEAGNRYIINCCRLICSVFKHSPVFRIGGDEFIVLLIGDDLNDIETLLKKFDERMEEMDKVAESPEEKVNVAAGLAVFDETRDHSYEDVFKRADEAMYKKKALMKGTRI